jgi:hypothetical protein
MQVYTLNVTNLDTDQPVVTFEPNGFAEKIEQGSTKVTVLDTGSGVNASSLKYVWSTSEVEPATGWVSFTNNATLT